MRRAARCLIIAGVTRRIFVSDLRSGSIELSTDQAHHARNVLRLSAGDAVELFDAAGQVSDGVIEGCDERAVTVAAQPPRIDRAGTMPHLTVASAVPKGERADWMVEKLSELGVDVFVPLRTHRGVVLPEGRNKRDRWLRLATESAKQSRRRGVMRIAELTGLEDAVQADGAGWCLSTSRETRPIASLLTAALPDSLSLYIGPEGGWSDDELRLFERRAVVGVSLTASILRIETAAVVAAAMVRCFRKSEI